MASSLGVLSNWLVFDSMFGLPVTKLFSKMRVFPVLGRLRLLKDLVKNGFIPNKRTVFFVV